MSEGKPYMNIKEAAEFLGVSRTLIYRAIKDGKLVPEPPSTLYEGKGPVRIPRAQVLALLPKPQP